MASWSEFKAAMPDMAAAGEEALFRSGSGDGLLTTVAGDDLPRTHPVNVGIVDGRLMTFVQGAFRQGTGSDDRWTLRPPRAPRSEPTSRVPASRPRNVVTDAAMRAAAAASWPFTPDGSYPLVELDIEHALFGDRADPDAWPPVYTSWRPTRR